MDNLLRQNIQEQEVDKDEVELTVEQEEEMIKDAIDELIEPLDINDPEEEEIRQLLNELENEEDDPYQKNKVGSVVIGAGPRKSRSTKKQTDRNKLGPAERRGQFKIRKGEDINNVGQSTLRGWNS